MGRDRPGPRLDETVSNSGDLPQALYGRETLNRLGEAGWLAVVDAPLEWAPVRWIAETSGCSCFLMLLVALWALRRQGVDVLALGAAVLCYDLGTMLLLCGDDARFPVLNGRMHSMRACAALSAKD